MNMNKYIDLKSQNKRQEVDNLPAGTWANRCKRSLGMIAMVALRLCLLSLAWHYNCLNCKELFGHFGKASDEGMFGCWYRRDHVRTLQDFRMSLACVWRVVCGFCLACQILHQVDYVFIPPPGNLRRHEPGFVRLAHSDTVKGLEYKEKPLLLKRDLVLLPDLPVIRFWNSEGAASAFKASQNGTAPSSVAVRVHIWCVGAIQWLQALTSRLSGLWDESKGKEHVQAYTASFQHFDRCQKCSNSRTVSLQCLLFCLRFRQTKSTGRTDKTHTLLSTIAAMTKFRSHDDCQCLDIFLDRKAAAAEHVWEHGGAEGHGLTKFAVAWTTKRPVHLCIAMDTVGHFRNLRMVAKRTRLPLKREGVTLSCSSFGLELPASFEPEKKMAG